MKALFVILTMTISTVASAVMIPVNPSPEIITYCSQVANQITCSNGALCTLQGENFANCNNGVTCNMAPTGAVHCSNGNSCQQTGTTLYCNQGVTCSQSSPTSFSCRL